MLKWTDNFSIKDNDEIVHNFDFAQKQNYCIATLTSVCGVCCKSTIAKACLVITDLATLNTIKKTIYTNYLPVSITNLPHSKYEFHCELEDECGNTIKSNSIVTHIPFRSKYLSFSI